MLALDCGNSRIKWARYEAGRMIDRGTASLDDDEDPAVVLGQALVRGTDRVLIANVAGPAMASRLDRAVRSELGVEPEFVAVQPAAYGIDCGYREPATLGVDRWLAMIAARRLTDGLFAVVSAGTAITFDGVDAAGRHLGGLILPGDRLMIEALAAHTQQIGIVAPAGERKPGSGLLGRTTRDAVAHGTRLAMAAAIDHAAGVLASAAGAAPRLFVTGGDAELVVGWLATPAEVRADLVLTGLAQIAAARE